MINQADPVEHYETEELTDFEAEHGGMFTVHREKDTDNYAVTYKGNTVFWITGAELKEVLEVVE
ncbi:MAG: hypothetical protein ACI8Z7_000207 [Candidatus Nanohaloarchaea archaeon]|jgi:hypothetical protein